jgi:hypothetical protein
MLLWKQFLLDLIAPPLLACLWWLVSRGWASTVQGENGLPIAGNRGASDSSRIFG